jgi:hypothetical protein
MGAPAVSGATSDREALIKDALSVAPPLIAKTATVKDWDGATMDRRGPHTMILLHDPAQWTRCRRTRTGVDPIPCGGGTPYAHIMVPVGKRPAASRCATSDAIRSIEAAYHSARTQIGARVSKLTAAQSSVQAGDRSDP